MRGVCEQHGVMKTVCVDLSAAYDTVNHRVLLTKLYGMTEDAEFTNLITIRRMVYLKGVLSHPCYVHNETRSFIYANNLCIATQRSTFEQTETILTETLYNLGEYYERNHLCTNPAKTQAWTVSHLINTFSFEHTHLY